MAGFHSHANWSGICNSVFTAEYGCTSGAASSVSKPIIKPSTFLYLRQPQRECVVHTAYLLVGITRIAQHTRQYLAPALICSIVLMPISNVGKRLDFHNQSSVWLNRSMIGYRIGSWDAILKISARGRWEKGVIYRSIKICQMLTFCITSNVTFCAND